MRSTDELGTDRRARATLTRVGKKVTIPEMTVTPTRPRSNTRMISGVMATSGTARSAMATGMEPCSNTGHRLKARATASPAMVPANSPRPASRTVMSVASHRMVRAGPLPDAVR